MSSLSALKFDVSDCTLREQSDEHAGWSNANGVYIVLRVPKRATNWSFELDDIDTATSYFSQQCASNGGALIEMDHVSVGGQTALRGLFKYRSPIADSMGLMFVSILWLRLSDVTAQINVESVELGVSGVRETTVCVMTGQSPASASPNEPVMMDSMEDMFAHMRAQPLQVVPSDDSQYDKMFPDHPLSKVRQRMAQLEATLSIAARQEARAAPGQAPWWKFW